MNRDFKGVWIPKDIWLSKDLGWSEKLLLVEIESLDNDDKCFANNQYFAEFFGLSKSRISKLISNLKAKGYIEIDLIYKAGTKEIERRTITTIPYRRKQLGGIGENSDTLCHKTAIGYGRKEGYPIGENSQDSNTVNNTINNTINKKKDEAEKNGFPVQTGDLFSERSTKKTSNVPAARSYKKLMDLYYDWYKKKNDGIPPKIDGAEGKALKSIAAYLEKIARDKFPEYKEEGIITEAEKFLSYIFSKWERLEPFYQKQIKLTQISSNISNIIHQLKNGHKTQSAGEQKRDRAGNIARAFDEIDAMFGPKQ